MSDPSGLSPVCGALALRSKTKPGSSDSQGHKRPPQEQKLDTGFTIRIHSMFDTNAAGTSWLSAPGTHDRPIYVYSYFSPTFPAFLKPTIAMTPQATIYANMVQS